MITSTSNGRVKRLLNLQKKHRARAEEQVFLAEGIRMFREMPGQLLQEIYVSETFYHKEKKLIAETADKASVKPEILADHVFEYISDTKTPQGVLCVAEQSMHELSQVLDDNGGAQHILVLDGLQDPGNVGTLVRTAEGAGVTGIVMSNDCVDIYNPKTIRSTMGSIFRMRICYTEALPEAIDVIKNRGIQVFAAHLDGMQSYEEENYRTACAFLIGNEGNGLRKEVACKADKYIKIPMAGKVESLNAAIAASVLMFEVGRQRRHQ